jgi:AraC-like DNA-binding protein
LEQDFTEPQRGLVEFQYRYERATRLLGVDPLARQIFRTLYFEPDERWNVSKLAERFDCSRGTVRPIVARNVRAGYMSKRNRHICMSDEGFRVLLWVHSETFDIAIGERVGFSEELIRLFRDVGLLSVSPESRTICFPRKLNIF